MSEDPRAVFRWLRRLAIRVRRSGPATASGGLANTGVIHTDSMTVHAAPIPHSDYLIQVRAMAPPELLARARELDELASFCTAADPGPSYLWWCAPAWAGKSALMAWFVLNPPPGVRVVSFFITARYSGQSDRLAFTDVVIEQLGEMLDEPLPALYSNHTRDAHFRGLLERAADACRQNGERLVLLVDGLDEDRGVTTGPNAHSIAALLPADPPAGMRVVVAGRPSPPIPSDVPDSHPLRDPAVVRSLMASPHAKAVRQDAERELKHLLDGSPVELDLLGLLTAAGGGLAAADLAELINVPRWMIEQHLAAVSARTFTARNGRWRSDTTVYTLGHEELQNQANAFLGPQDLDSYRQRLHSWADTYRSSGWPADAPEYLLSGYFRLLRETGDLARMVTLGRCQARHERMFTVSGGDAAAISEITLAQDMLLAQGGVDLPAIAQLAVHRVRLTKRAESTPVNLPLVYALLYQPRRAEALARSMPDADRRAWALAGVARALATRGDISRAEAIASTITEARWQLYAWAGIARELGKAGDIARAREAAERTVAAMLSVDDLSSDVSAVANVVEALAVCGEYQRARARATMVAPFLAGPPEEWEKAQGAWVWAELAGPLAHAGDATGAEALVELVDHPRWQAFAWMGLARAMAATGRVELAEQFADRAERVCEDISEPTDLALPLAPLITVYAEVGNPGRIRDVVQRISSAGPADGEWPARIPYPLAEVAKALALAGDLDQAGVFADRAQRATLAMAHLDHELDALGLADH